MTKWEEDIKKVTYLISFSNKTNILSIRFIDKKI